MTRLRELEGVTVGGPDRGRKVALVVAAAALGLSAAGVTALLGHSGPAVIVLLLGTLAFLSGLSTLWSP